MFSGAKNHPKAPYFDPVNHCTNKQAHNADSPEGLLSRVRANVLPQVTERCKVLGASF